MLDGVELLVTVTACANRRLTGTARRRNDDATAASARSCS
jgi:hypothetical protein